MKSNYGSKDYWDERYSRETEPFEWYQTYSTLRPFLTSKYLTHQTCDDKENTDTESDTIQPPATTPASAQRSPKSASRTNPPPPPHSFPTKDKCRVLIVGCGSSSLGEDMLKDGWLGDIAQVDYSSVVVERMKERYNEEFYEKVQGRLKRKMMKELREKEGEKNATVGKDGKGLRPSSTNDLDLKPAAKMPAATKPSPVKPAPVKPAPVEKKMSKNSTSSEIKCPKMKFDCADATESLPYSSSTFDLVLVKGTIDAVLCSANPQNIYKMMGECSRVLDKGGVMVVVSHGSPENRMVYFETEEYWSGFSVQYIPKPRVGSALEKNDKSEYHYMYICSKANRKEDKKEDEKLASQVEKIEL